MESVSTFFFGTISAEESRFSTSRHFSHGATFFEAKFFDNGKYKKDATNKIGNNRPEVFRK